MKTNYNNKIKIWIQLKTYTKKFKPWKVFYVEEYDTKTEALKRELFLKSPKGYLELLNIKNGGVA